MCLHFRSVRVSRLSVFSNNDGPRSLLSTRISIMHSKCLGIRTSQYSYGVLVHADDVSMRVMLLEHLHFRNLEVPMLSFIFETFYRSFV